ncbi:MAG TPA: dienelactone hydrolase family protein [Acidimicrobiales bacterium]|nr:dienelactone hydrolase family protein [Acidimicrobiales bacterium]
MADIQLPYFLARPAPPVTAGIVVIHEGNGISAQLLRVCERLAAEGYAAIAPDLFFRAGGTEAADFGTLIGSLDRERTAADLAESAAVLRALGARKVGVTGFCMGGLQTYRAAATTSTFDAAVGFYGATISRELGTPRCPTLLFFGDADPYIPQAEIDAVAAHHPDTVVYHGAGHGFFRDGSENYDQAAAEDALKRLLAHFDAHLRA